MALAEPSGLMHPYLLLTLHGFLWHFMLIFIGLYCAMTGLGGRTPGDFCIHAPPVFGLHMHSHVHKCGFPSLRQCRYVLYQPLLSKRTDCFPPDCPHHRYGRRKPTVPGSHGFGRLYLPPVPGPAVSPLTVLTVSAAARLQPSIQTFRLSVMQIFCHADFQFFKKPPLSGILPDPRRLLPCPLSLIRSLFQKFAQIGKGGFLPWSFSMWRSFSKSALVLGWMVM